MHSLGDGLGIPIRRVDARRSGSSASSPASTIRRRSARRSAGVFIDVFEAEAKRLPKPATVRFLAQGTLYPDVIESVSVKGPSAVDQDAPQRRRPAGDAGLRADRAAAQLFKDEVRQLGRELGLPEELIRPPPLPGSGPGGAHPRRGDRRARRAAPGGGRHLHRGAARDAAGTTRSSQAFAVLLPVKSVGVMGDYRTYENVVALRAVETQDFMTADWARSPTTSSAASPTASSTRSAASTAWSTTSPASRRARSSGSSRRLTAPERRRSGFPYEDDAVLKCRWAAGR